MRRITRGHPEYIYVYFFPPLLLWLRFFREKGPGRPCPSSSANPKRACDYDRFPLQIVGTANSPDRESNLNRPATGTFARFTTRAPELGGTTRTTRTERANGSATPEPQLAGPLTFVFRLPLPLGRKTTVAVVLSSRKGRADDHRRRRVRRGIGNGPVRGDRGYGVRPAPGGGPSPWLRVKGRRARSERPGTGGDNA